LDSEGFLNSRGCFLHFLKSLTSASDTTFLALHRNAREVCVLFHFLIAKFAFFRNGYFMNPAWAKDHEIKGEKGAAIGGPPKPGRGSMKCFNPSD